MGYHGALRPRVAVLVLAAGILPLPALVVCGGRRAAGDPLPGLAWIGPVWCARAAVNALARSPGLRHRVLADTTDPAALVRRSGVALVRFVVAFGLYLVSLRAVAWA